MDKNVLQNPTSENTNQCYSKLSRKRVCLASTSSFVLLFVEIRNRQHFLGGVRPTEFWIRVIRPALHVNHLSDPSSIWIWCNTDYFLTMGQIIDF